MARFSQEFDAFVETIRSEWIQVRRRDEDKGLFDFRINEQQVSVFSASISDELTFHDFVDAVLLFLMQTLERNLATVREQLLSVGRETLDSMVAALLRDVAEYSQDFPLTELETAIKEARIELNHAVKRVSEWFQLPKEESAQPFELSFAITVAYESINRIGRNVGIRPQFKSSEDLTVSSVHLPKIVNLFGNVFDNIVRHAGTGHPPYVEITLQRNKDSIAVVVENEIKPSVKCDTAEAKLDRIRLAMESGVYASSLTTEGGTGLLKSFKILQRDLPGPTQLSFGFSGESRFRVSICLSDKMGS